LPWVVPIAALLLTVAVLDYYWSRGQGELSLPTLPPAPEAPPLARRADAASNAAAPNAAASQPNRRKPQASAAHASQAHDKPTASAAVTGREKPPTPSERPTRSEGSQGIKPAPSAVAEPSAAEKALSRLADEIYTSARSLAELSPLRLPWEAEPPAPPTKSTAGTPGRTSAGEASSALAQRASSGERDGVLIVSPYDEGSQSYTTLEAACAAAKSGDVIELRFDGRRVERPIQLTNTRLTIRPGKGFRPVIAFRPDDADPVKSPRSMIAVSGGQLTLLDVHLELQVPRRAIADSWVLFELRKAEMIRVERSTLTVRNAGYGQAALQPGVAIFDVKAAPGADAMMVMPLASPAEGELQAVAIELKDCIARGEAALLHSSQGQSLRLTWDNGLLATSERLLSVSGAAGARQTAHVQLDLRRLTAVVRGGLCGVMANDQAPFQPSIDVRCADCILIGGGGPLIEQRGMDRVDAQRARLHWSGTRVFYEGFESFWRLADLSTAASPTKVDFSQWRTHWGEQNEVQPRLDAVAWRGLPHPLAPLSTHSPIDYALATSGPNPAVGAASDGDDAGCRRSQLPDLPAEPASPPAEPADEDEKPASAKRSGE
jgi:serine/threonine-protein kinase